MNKLEVRKNIKPGTKKFIIAGIAVVILTSVMLYFKSLSNNIIEVKDNQITIYGMYIDPNCTYEVRKNTLIQINENGEEKAIMELSSSQARALENKYSRGFVLDLSK